jgi:hypothetical protein
MIISYQLGKNKYLFLITENDLALLDSMLLSKTSPDSNAMSGGICFWGEKFSVRESQIPQTARKS